MISWLASRERAGDEAASPPPHLPPTQGRDQEWGPAGPTHHRPPPAFQELRSPKEADSSAMNAGVTMAGVVSGTWDQDFHLSQNRGAAGGSHIADTLDVRLSEGGDSKSPPLAPRGSKEACLSGLWVGRNKSEKSKSRASTSHRLRTKTYATFVATKLVQSWS